MKKMLCGFLVASGLILGGCSQSGETLTLTVAEIPEATLRCLPAPYRQEKFVKVSQKQVAYLLTRYKTAHADCESKLGTVRNLYNKWKIETAKVN